MNNNRRSSLFTIVVIIVLATVTFVAAIVAVLFSIYGYDLYVNYKTADLTLNARSISQQAAQLYLKNTERLNYLELIRPEDISVPESASYVISKDGNMITSEETEPSARVLEAVKSCETEVMQGKTVTVPNASVGILIGVPVRDDADNVIGAVVLIHKSTAIHDRVNTLAMQFALAMIAILLIALIPSVLVFRYVTKPIKAVSETALKLAHGDLDVRAVPSGSFESQHLAQSFNTLADALRSNIDHLVIERNRLGAVLNGIGEGIIAVDRHGDFTHFNSAAIRLLGGGEGDAPSSLPNYPEVSRIVLRSLEANLPERGDISAANKLLRVTATPIHEDNGALFGAVTLISDITESERLEQTRRDYVANVSHELRTPLASIRSLADALSDGLVTDEADQKRYFGYIQRESIRLSHLIDDLLELSRLQSGGVAFSKGKVELYETVFDVADRMNEMAQQRGKSVLLNVPEDEYLANTNADRIEQVLIALVDNAIKHGEDGCRVTIDLYLTENGRSYAFTVANPAVIDPADLEHIFERFYKADHAHSGEGTGLGLAIVSEVLNLLNENIFVRYSSGMISFTFTVERHLRDGEHPRLAVCSSAALEASGGELTSAR